LEVIEEGLHCAWLGRGDGLQRLAEASVHRFAMRQLVATLIRQIVHIIDEPGNLSGVLCHLAHGRERREKARVHGDGLPLAPSVEYAAFVDQLRRQPLA
jgi:hypothetical protein